MVATVSPGAALGAGLLLLRNRPSLALVWGRVLGLGLDVGWGPPALGSWGHREAMDSPPAPSQG